MERFGLDGVFADDPGVSAAEQQRILRWCETGETDIPCTLAEGYRHLYGVPFTCRPDSPSWLVRFQESRQYAEPGREVAPAPAQPRPRGAITMDNALYGRYSGEIQLIRSSLPADEWVNVIGAVSSRHMLLADRLHRGGKFRLVPVESNSTGWKRQRVCGTYTVLMISREEDLLCEPCEAENMIREFLDYKVHVFCTQTGFWRFPEGRHWAPTLQINGIRR